MYKTFRRFLIVGTIGFLIDTLCFTLFIFLVTSPHIARLAAFLVAIGVTFRLNRRYTFSERANSSLSRYVLIQSLGVAINMAVFSLVIWHPVFLPWQYYAGIAAGSIAAMFFNFFMSSRYAFRHLANS